MFRLTAVELAIMEKSQGEELTKRKQIQDLRLRVNIARLRLGEIKYSGLMKLIS